MMLGLEGATAMAPIDWVGCESNIGTHVRPSSSDFQTPPFTAPAKKVCGWPGTPATARVRPPRRGPSIRHGRSCVMGARPGVAYVGIHGRVAADRREVLLVEIAPAGVACHQCRRETLRGCV